jgi:signal transduction histidine kinase
MLFLKDKNAGFVGIIIGAIIFITCVLIGGNHLSLWGGTVLIIGASISIIALIIWWRRSLTKLYQKWIRERNMQEYEALITEKDQQIQRLKESNESMANLIHRDNKLLPALYDAVKVLLHSTRKIADAELKLSSRNLMNQIEQIMDERAEIMHKYQRENKTLPSTNDALIDGVMAHMLHRTCENNIQFDLSAPDDISELTEIIPSIKLEMLCADLIENAIIAAMHSEHKKILVILGMSDGYYEINVQDSGIPFESATLLKLGRQKASTHLDEGGSGIGYMTIFEILREYRASLEITEYEQPRMGFTKSIRVRFDNNNQFVVLQSNKMIRLHG